jgi:hypothetical protein
MTQQENCPDVENPQVDLRPLDFREIENKDGKSVFQALIDDSEAPGKPVYALTVTTGSPSDDNAKENLYAFLKGMRAGFVLTAPNPDEDPCDDQEPEPFNIDTQTQIEPDLVQLRTLKGTFGVTVVVQTAVDAAVAKAEEVSAEPAPGAPIPYRATVQPGKEHSYTAVQGLNTATVTARQGSGTIRNPVKNITAGGGPRSLRASRVIVRGVTFCVYDFVGRFNKTS